MKTYAKVFIVGEVVIHLMLGQTWEKKNMEGCGMLCVMQVVVGAKFQKDPNFVNPSEFVKQML
jgi:type III secretory pathway component EscU